jgi:hypothetical protein
MVVADSPACKENAAPRDCNRTSRISDTKKYSTKIKYCHIPHMVC